MAYGGASPPWEHELVQESQGKCTGEATGDECSTKEDVN